MKSIFKSKYDQNKANINIWIDKDIKEALKIGAKKRGMLYGKYIQKLLRKAVERQNGVKYNEE